ncbi:MAG TPA: glycoside hydrolase family 2 TIM barrel-domain containing protein, partial [Bacteroidota bacterium]|nr:glycoside hydrolase family 2 TIM barrel-domain containing protein [Bacteroidota bacterium]
MRIAVPLNSALPGMLLGSLLAASAFALPALAGEIKGGGAAGTDTSIDAGWKFTRSDPPVEFPGGLPGAASPAYDDSRWDEVSLPHTWNALDGQDGGNDYYRGAGWYRARLPVGAGLKGWRVYLRFGGASSAARVYVNGMLAGEHRGAFGAFCIDVTPCVRFGASNLIAVRVSNARDTTLPPLSGDFTVFGGLYRTVHMIVRHPFSISPLDRGSAGVYVRQLSLGPDSARLAVDAVVRNAGSATEHGTLRCAIRDDRGVCVAWGEVPVSLPPGSATVRVEGIVIDHPRLWQGRDDPYLYTADVTLLSGIRPFDEVTQKFGLRTFDFDPARGFLLNGRPYPLHGVNRHQDREGKGWAIGQNEHEEDFRLIMDMGCTAVRLAHYEQAPEFYDLCDSGGLVVWAELSLVDRIGLSAAFASSCREQLAELILQNYNHPSIVAWSLANELIPDGREAAYSSLMIGLNDEARILDPGRRTTLASRGSYDWTSSLNTITDVIGYNLYKGWYEGTPGDFGPYVDALHARRPDRAMAISEYGAGAGIHQHEDPPSQPSPSGRWHPEEWQCALHESTWTAIAARPWIWGAFVWNMFDFASDGRSEGEMPGRNDKGLVTYDRRVKKDAYYWYRANWNPEPMVHITGRRFSPRRSPCDVKVYSNCESVALT